MCGGSETMFGTWNIVRPFRDCTDLQTALETRRDIFRKDMMNEKKQQRLEEMHEELCTSSDSVAYSSECATFLIDFTAFAPTHTSSRCGRDDGHEQRHGQSRSRRRTGQERCRF